MSADVVTALPLLLCHFVTFPLSEESHRPLQIHQTDKFQTTSYIKKTILQEIAEWLKDIIEAIKDILNDGELNGAGKLFAIALERIKKTEVSKQGNTNNGVTQSSHSVNISVPDLVSKINPKDIYLFKYITDQLLSEEQIGYKKRSLTAHQC